MAREIESWGRWPRPSHQRLLRLHDRFAALPAAGALLPYGNGRSYGDVCLNQDGVLLSTRGLDRFIAFDEQTGLLDCEAGVLLEEIIGLTLSKGWFLPVTPGTSQVTVGGAIANEVHGKNHHRMGTFCHHVVELELARSSSEVLHCSREQNPEWFAATCGGLGLTGLIRTARLQLRRVPGPWLRGDHLRFANLKEFLELAYQSDREFEYTVGWLDCTAKGAHLGRGVLLRASHGAAVGGQREPRSLTVPLVLPLSLVNAWSVRLFNQWYYRRASAQQRDARMHYRSFFYPLDRVAHWNRIYGPRGFFQYQCVVPKASAELSLSELLMRISRSGRGSFLAVIKSFGDRAAVGMLGFPRPGVTLALDFPNEGASTLALLESLDDVTRAAGGAVYPAKDARMSAHTFRHSFPNWEQFAGYIDPAFSSSFWRRVSSRTL
jgi:FAD/FMN-containing dehydrogenase